MVGIKKQDNKEAEPVKDNKTSMANVDQKEEDAAKGLKGKVKIHWFMVFFVVLLVFLIGFLNEVSISENLTRCFYAGSIFWIFAEIIDYILNW